MISQTKLKVMLSADDMKKLDFDPCAGGDVSGRAAFRNILKEAREKCGFDAVGERVFVQYYPEKHGGCEMFVTKLSAGGRFADAENQKRTDGIKHGHEYIVYRFERLCDLLSLCGLLKRRKYSGDSVFFVLDEKSRRYYIRLNAEECAAGEYGGAAVGRGEYLYLVEHGRKICSDAVNNLGDLG